jgi:hypothetical protein
MKVDQEKLKQAVAENLTRCKEDRLTCKELGTFMGVSGPRISQIASGLKANAPDRAEAANDESNAPEAA